MTVPSPTEYNPLDLLAAIRELALATMSGDETRKVAARENYERIKAS